MPNDPYGILPDKTDFPRPQKIDWAAYDRINNQLQQIQQTSINNINTFARTIDLSLGRTINDAMQSSIIAAQSAQTAAQQAGATMGMTQLNTQLAIQQTTAIGQQSMMGFQGAVGGAMGIMGSTARTISGAIIQTGQVAQQIQQTITGTPAIALPGVEYTIPFTRRLFSTPGLILANVLGKLGQAVPSTLASLGVGALGSMINPAIGVVGGIAAYTAIEALLHPLAKFPEDIGNVYQAYNLAREGLNLTGGIQVNPLAFAVGIQSMANERLYDLNAQQLMATTQLGITTGAIGGAFGQTLDTNTLLRQLRSYKTSLLQVMKVFKLGLQEAATIVSEFQTLGFTPEQASNLAIQLGSVSDWLRVSGQAVKESVRQGAQVAQTLGLPTQIGAISGFQWGVAAAANLPLDPLRAAQTAAIGTTVTQQVMAQFAPAMSGIGAAGVAQFAVTGNPFQLILGGVAGYLGGGTPTDIMRSWALQPYRLQAMPPGMQNLAMLSYLRNIAQMIGISTNDPFAMAGLLNTMAGGRLSQQQALDLYRTLETMPVAIEMQRQNAEIYASRQFAENAWNRWRRNITEAGLDWVYRTFGPESWRYALYEVGAIAERSLEPIEWRAKAIRGWWEGVRYIRGIEKLPIYTPREAMRVREAWEATKYGYIERFGQEEVRRKALRETAYDIVKAELARSPGIIETIWQTYGLGRPRERISPLYTTEEMTVMAREGLIPGEIIPEEMSRLRQQGNVAALKAKVESIVNTLDIMGRTETVAAVAGTTDVQKMMGEFELMKPGSAKIEFAKTLVDQIAVGTGAKDFESLGSWERMSVYHELSGYDLSFTRRAIAGDTSLSTQQKRFLQVESKLTLEFGDIVKKENPRSTREFMDLAKRFLRGKGYTENVDEFAGILLKNYLQTYGTQGPIGRELARSVARTNPAVLQRLSAEEKAQMRNEWITGVKQSVGHVQASGMGIAVETGKRMYLASLGGPIGLLAGIPLAIFTGKQAAEEQVTAEALDEVFSILADKSVMLAGVAEKPEELARALETLATQQGVSPQARAILRNLAEKARAGEGITIGGTKYGIAEIVREPALLAVPEEVKKGVGAVPTAAGSTETVYQYMRDIANANQVVAEIGKEILGK